LPQHRAGDLGLGGEVDLRGDARLAATRSVVGPRFGQIQRPIEEGGAADRAISQEYPDLAVLDPASCAAVLPGNTGGFRALLEEACLVDDQDAVVVPEVLYDVAAEVVANRIGIPAGPAQEALDAMGRGVADRLGQLPGVLAFDTAQKPAEIPPRRVS
jgi:hypothetical protein